MPDTPKLDLTALESNIKLLIQKRGITQTRLADDLHMSQSMFNKHLKGHPCFSIEEIFDIAQYFNVSIDALCSNSFSDVLNTMPEPKEKPKTFTPLRGNAAVYAVCHGLAEVFKHGSLMTGTMHLTEVVYKEDIDQYEQPTGHYSPARTSLGGDPTNDYPAVYFSNYWPVVYSCEPGEDLEEYFMDLQYGGNFDERNYKINKFFQKLVDLNSTYKKDSIQYEDYCRSIDNLLKELPKE